MRTGTVLGLGIMIAATGCTLPLSKSGHSSTLENRPVNPSALAHYGLGVHLSTIKPPHSEEAVFHFQEAVKHDPLEWRHHDRLARELLLLDRPGEAAASLEQLLALKDYHPDIAYRLIRAYQEDGQHSAALTVTDAFLEDYPEASEFYECRIRSYAALGDAEALSSTLAMAVSTTTNPDSVIDALNVIGNQLVKDGEFEKASQCALLLIHQRPDSSTSRALMVLAIRGMLGNNNYSGSVPLVEKLVELVPDNPKFRELLIACYQETGNIDGQINIQKDLITRLPDDPIGYFNLAAMFEQIGKTDLAVKHYLTCISLNPDFADPYLRMAQNLFVLDREGEAFDTIDEAISLFPEDSAIYAYKGMALNLRKNFEPAIHAFEKAESLENFKEKDPLFQSAFYYSYGAAWERQGNAEKAETFLRLSLEVNPEEHRAQNYLAYMWAEKSVNLDEAVSLIKQALKHDPANPAYLDTYGWILFKQGHYDLALAYLTSAWELMPNDPTVCEHLGDCLNKLDKERQAVKWWKKSYELDPSNTSVYNKLKSHGVDVSRPTESVNSSGL